MKALKSAALVPEVLPPQRSPEGERGLRDFFFFATHFCGLDLEEDVHREVTEAIEAVELGRAQSSLIVIPRGHFKTTIASAAVVWKLYRRVLLDNDPFYRIMVSSATLALGEQILKRIEGILLSGGKNQRLHHEYPKLWADRTWGNPGSRQPDGLYVKQRLGKSDPGRPEPSVWVGSLRRISTGFHADEAYLDDLNNRENVQTPFQRAKVQDYFDLIRPILVQKAHGTPPKITYTCTPWHDDDVRGRIEKAEEARRIDSPHAPHEWEIVRFSAFREDGSPRFPSRFPIEALEKMRREMSTQLFSANFLCDPVGDATFVKEEWIRFKDPASFPPLSHVRISVDPNQHKEAKVAGCYAAIVVEGFDRFGGMYVLDADGSRTWSSEQFIARLFEFREKYPEAKLLIEDAHMAHFEHAVRLEESRRSEAAGHPVRLRVTWVPVPTNRSKYERYEKLEPRFRARAAVLADTIAPELKREIVDELVRGEKAKFQDFLDAMAQGDTGFRPKIARDGTPAPVHQPGPAEDGPRLPTASEAFGGMFQ